MSKYATSVADNTNVSPTVYREGRGCFVLNCPSQMEWKARVDLLEVLKQDVGRSQIKRLIVSLDAVQFISSAGIGAIFTLRKFLAKRGARMVICGTTPVITRLLETVNLPALIPLAKDIDHARVLLEDDSFPWNATNTLNT